MPCVSSPRLGRPVFESSKRKFNMTYGPQLPVWALLASGSTSGVRPALPFLSLPLSFSLTILQIAYWLACYPLGQSIPLTYPLPSQPDLLSSCSLGRRSQVAHLAPPDPAEWLAGAVRRARAARDRRRERCARAGAGAHAVSYVPLSFCLFVCWWLIRTRALLGVVIRRYARFSSRSRA